MQKKLFVNADVQTPTSFDGGKKYENCILFLFSQISIFIEESSS